MERVLLANDRSIRLVQIPGEAGVFSFLEFISAAQARAYLEEYQYDSGAMEQLRMALAADSMGIETSRLDDAEVIDQLAERVVLRQIAVAEEVEGEIVVDEPEQIETTAAPPPVLPRSTQPKLTWIEFKVVWEDTGQPVANVRLIVKDSNGAEKFSDTNSEGKIRYDEIEPGTFDLRCEVKGAKAAETLGFVTMGEAKVKEGGNGAAKKAPGALRILLVDPHKVKKGESIKSLAEGVGMTWQELSKFNWGTDVPDKINIALRTRVGCTKKTKDGYNYVFDDSDDPGIVFIPKKWEETGLATGLTHVIQVRRYKHIYILFDENKKKRLPHYEYLVFDGDEHVSTGESSADAIIETDALPEDWFIDVIGPGPSHPVWKQKDEGEAAPPPEEAEPAPPPGPEDSDPLTDEPGGPPGDQESSDNSGLPRGD